MGSDVTNLTNIGLQSSFRYSFSFLPKDQRVALNTVYAFCRTTDDIVDNEGDVNQKAIVLHKWRMELGKALHNGSEYQLLNQLAHIANKFNIPVQHFYELIEGVEMDLMKSRYQTFDELKNYCYLVASSVGLMSVKIFGSINDRITNYAENLGIALQLTNILRDIKTDAKVNRIYLPQSDLKEYGYSENEIFSSVYNANFVNLMKFETERAEKYYSIAKESLRPEDKKFLFAPKIMERIYYHTLLRIKGNNYNVYDKSMRLPPAFQFMIAVKYLLKYRFLKTV
jgi:15-cis-phytoene synthase